MKLKIKLRQYIVANQLNTKKILWGIQFKSNDDLHLNKILSIPIMIITVGFILQKGNKYCTQVYFHECLYEFVSEL